MVHHAAPHADGLFLFEVVAPEKLVLHRHAAMVVVPGAEGDFGVLIDHAPTVTTLRPGVVSVYDSGAATPSDKLFVSGGFAEVTPERCVLMADDVVPVAELDRAALQDKLKELQEAKALAATDAERDHLQTQLDIAAAKLQATGGA